MPNIRAYIDNAISSNTSAGGNNLYGRISARVKLFKEANKKGTLNPSAYKGIDKLIAERVIALCKVDNATEIPVSKNTEEVVKKGKAYFSLVEEMSDISGYVTWAGNESYICPWLTEYISADSTETSSDRFTPTQSLKYIKHCNGIKFNTTSVLTDQNRQIALTSTQVAKFSKSAKKLTIALINDNDAFTSDGASGSPLKTVDLSSVLPSGEWCYGKILKYGDYLLVGVYSFADERSKNTFEQPKLGYSNDDDAKGYSVDASLIIVNTVSGKVKKLEQPAIIQQTKLKIIGGYTDHIVHMNKIYAIRSSTPSSVSWSAFALKHRKDKEGKYIQGYDKTNTPWKFSFTSYKYEIVEIIISDTASLDITELIVAEVKPPPVESDGKFQITGSKIMYTAAKLAANNLNPYTFYVQQFYELVFQLPYNYDKKFAGPIYWETTLGKRLRTDSNFYDWILSGDAAYNTNIGSLITQLSGVYYGMITKIVGQIYLEIPTAYNQESKTYTVKTSGSDSDAIYELVGEAQPGFDPEFGWVVFKPLSYGGRTPNANALDLWVVWHLASSRLGEGAPKSNSIVADLNLQIFTSDHPFAIDIKAKLNAKEAVVPLAVDIAKSGWGIGKETPWSYVLEKEIGSFSFPYEKWFCYFGGNRGTSSWPVSGYDSWSETFLVTYAGTKFAKEGARSEETARPVLIIAGIGPYAEAWGAKGWGGQITQSPLVVECWNYQTIAGERMQIFSQCNSASQPDVYMQANENVLGTIGNYWTGYDLTDPTIELKHGMYPIAQNGFHIDDAKNKIITNSLCFTDMRIPEDNLSQIYYALFTYSSEYNDTQRKYELNNYYLENRAYDCKNPKKVITPEGQMPPAAGDLSMLDLYAAKAIAYWWSRTAPARPTDPVPWWGPCQIDFHVKI
jgi:hypothetical protein